jgi:uncharacterized protein
VSRRAGSVLCAALTVVLGGCALLVARPLPPRFYLLTALAQPDPSAPTRPDLVLGLGPVRLAGYLDQPALVTRVDPNQVQPSGVDRWASPLPRSVTAVLVENLSTLLAPRELIIYPWYRTADVGCQVRVDLRWLERRPGGRIALAGRWSVEELGGSHEVRQHDFVWERTVTPDDTDAAVASLSAGLAAMSQEIAEAVRQVTVYPVVPPRR